MAYLATELGKIAEGANPVIFDLRPEAQWKVAEPRCVEDLISGELASERLDLPVSTSLRDRWDYTFWSSAAHSDFEELHNFSLLISVMGITQPERKTQRLIPDWILGWAKEFEKDGLTVEEAIQEARRNSRKFKTALSAEIIADRDKR